MIKVVFLDIDNTLIDFSKCSRLAIKYGIESIGMEYEEVIFDTFTRINDELWLEIEKGTITKEQLYNERWHTIFNELGIDYDGLKFESIFFNNLTEIAIPVDYAKELVEYLAAKYTLCAASNGPYKQQVNRLTSAGMIDNFKEIFVSEEIGFSKPSREFFNVCFARLGDVRSEEVMIIGDSLTADIKGGIDCGMKTLWYNHFKAENDGKINADYTVDSLKEIEKIL